MEVKNRIVFDGDYLEYPFILDVMTNEKTIIDANDWFLPDLAVSPNGKWLAYRYREQDWSNEQLHIASADGTLVKQIAWEPNWRIITGWQGNEQVWISRQRGEYDYDDLMLLNPFTGARTEFPVNYPEAADRFPRIGWGLFDFSAKKYDPTLSKVIYLSGSKSMIIWDLNRHQELLKITGTISNPGGPLWSPDGRRLHFLGPPELASQNSDNRDELYYVDVDGTIIRLTYFSEYFEQVYLGPYSWSPDGRYVALGSLVRPNDYPNIYNVRKQGNRRLFIIDTRTNQTTDYCVPAGSFYNPVWLPGGRQLVIDNQLDPQSHKEVYLIDLDKELAVKIAEDASPVGWLEAVPMTQP